MSKQPLSLTATQAEQLAAIIRDSEQRAKTITGVDMQMQLVTHSIIHTSNSMLMDKLLNMVCNEYHIVPAQLKGRLRKQPVTDARHMFCLLAHEVFGITYNAIGGFIGGRDHSTIINSIRVMKAMIETEDTSARIYAHLRQQAGKWLTTE